MITLAADGAAPASPARWREAVEHHAARTPVPRSTWDAMEVSARQRAFTVSGITSTQLLTDVHGAIDRAVANGTTLRDFKREMESRLTSEWGAPNAARVETIFRTNVQTAYNAGRHAQMSSPTAMALRPYWAFQAILDKRTSDTCSPLDKVTRPVGDEFWDSHWPPLHFNCRSTVTSLSRREFDRLAASPAGVKTEAVHPDGRPVKPPHEGFGASPDLPGANLRAPRTTPPDVQRAYDNRASAAPAAVSRTAAPDHLPPLTPELEARRGAMALGIYDLPRALTATEIDEGRRVANEAAERLQIPQQQRGLPNYRGYGVGQTFNPGGVTVGTNIPTLGVEVHGHIFFEVPGWDEWNAATPDERALAVLQHEWLEYNLGDHDKALHAGLFPNGLVPGNGQRILETMKRGLDLIEEHGFR